MKRGPMPLHATVWLHTYRVSTRESRYQKSLLIQIFRGHSCSWDDWPAETIDRNNLAHEFCVLIGFCCISPLKSASIPVITRCMPNISGIKFITLEYDVRIPYALGNPILILYTKKCLERGALKQAIITLKLKKYSKLPFIQIASIKPVMVSCSSHIIPIQPYRSTVLVHYTIKRTFYTLLMQLLASALSVLHMIKFSLLYYVHKHPINSSCTKPHCLVISFTSLLPAWL